MSETSTLNSPLQRPSAPRTSGSRRPEWLTTATVSSYLLRHVMVVVMLLVVCFFLYRSARSGTVENFSSILGAAAPFALIALGQTLVILTGGIDLSVGSVIAASAMSAALVAKSNPGNILLAVVVAAGVGLLAGLVNRLVISKLNVPPFIATLGMLTLVCGIAYVIGGGAPINGLPASFGDIANTKVLGVTVPVLVMAISIAGFALLMRFTSYGMRAYSTGDNRQAAEIAGIRTSGVLLSVYVISGLLAGVSEFMLASRVVSAAPNLGTGYELAAIAAVVIGGASLIGGRGTILGTAVGLLLIQTLNNGLDLLLVPSCWQDVIKGVLIVLAVSIDVWASRRLAR